MDRVVLAAGVVMPALSIAVYAAIRGGALSEACDDSAQQAIATAALVSFIAFIMSMCAIGSSVGFAIITTLAPPTRKAWYGCILWFGVSVAIILNMFAFVTYWRPFYFYNGCVYSAAGLVSGLLVAQIVWFIVALTCGIAYSVWQFGGCGRRCRNKVHDGVAQLPRGIEPV